MSVLAALLAAGAVWCLLAPPVPAPGPESRRRMPGGAFGVAALGGGVVVVVVLLDGKRLVLGLIGVAVAAAVTRAVRRRAAARVAEHRAELVLACCDSLASDLGAGQPPLLALRRAAADWPEFAPVAAAGAIDADVPDAFRGLSVLPGAGQLRQLGAAWQVADRTGAGLADAIGRTAEDIRARRRTQRLVRGELSSAEATSRMLAVLPVGVLLMGSGVGGDPFHFLLETPAGLACLAAGLLLSWLGMVWLEHIAEGVLR